IIISILGACGNSTVIMVVVMNKRLHTFTNYLLVNLSVADFLVSVVAIPFRVIHGHDSGEVLPPCHVTLGLTVLFDGASRINITLIALDRLIAIKWPFKYRQLSTIKVLLSSVVCVWIFGVVFGLLPVNGIGLNSGETRKEMCFFHSSLSDSYVYSYLVLFCILPLVIVVPVNVFLFTASYKQM
ncbi:predicted protein, partial [Nematostella vectensis]